MEVERKIPFVYHRNIEFVPFINHASLNKTPREWVSISFPKEAEYPDLSIAKFEAVRCWACGQCEFSSMATWAMNCPTATFPKKYRQAAYRGQGKHMSVLGLLQGYIDPSPELVDIAFFCNLCGNCTLQCSMGLGSDPVVSVMALRRTLVKLGMGPPPAHRKFASMIKQYHNPYGEPPEAKFAWLKRKVEVKKKKADIAYFAGCTGPYRTPEVCEATTALLEAAGADFTILGGDEWCCGSPLYMVGLWEESKETLEHNIALLEDLGISRFISTCAGCFRQFYEGPKKLGISKPSFEVLHSSQLLCEYINSGRIKPKSIPTEKVITYHDPCHLGRHVGIFDDPREILSNLPGVKFIEFERTAHHAWCCGAGAGVMSGYPELARFAAIERLKEAKGVGASYISTACPFCVLNMKRADEAVGFGLEIGDVVQLLERSLR
ncbi:MAG: (Fe-S)-binding protein [Candidatus Methanomethyliaceae archaeon]|nr:(Fe-S)-binding protein [Candidatus Methanomethyliaceae archaeon]MDW7970873.1 (Fe-S)-binding protein [Nitrososphaerota archaeon]